MPEATALDLAHAAMQAAPEDDLARVAFYERLAEGELLMLLKTEPDGTSLDPELFETDGARFVLAFDRAERLAEFVGRPAPYAGLPGRTIAAMLAGQGIGLALNPDVAPSSILLGPEAMDWLHQTLGNRPTETTAVPASFDRPAGLPETVLRALDRKLARAEGLARLAYLASVTYDSGARGHMLAFVGAAPGAEPTLAAAVGEALTFSGVEAGTLDVSFLAASDPAAALLARVGLRFDLPQPAPIERAAPGSDPDRPPRLR